MTDRNKEFKKKCTRKISKGNINIYSKKLIEIVNSNDINKISEICSFSCSTDYCVFEKKFNYLFNDNAIYLKYVRGFYYYMFERKYLKAKNLMKKYYELNVIVNNIANCYERLKKHNKALYYHKKYKYNCKNIKYLYYSKYRVLSSFYFKHNNKNKSLYYFLHLKNQSDDFGYYILNMDKYKNNKSFIFNILK